MPDSSRSSSLTRETLTPDFTVLVIDNAFATAKVSLFGAQVLQYCPKHDGRERLFLSSKAKLDGSKSVRGGIPICWPWFGAYKGAETGMPAHGYARTRQWELVSSEESAAGTTLQLQLADCSGPGFNGSARLQLTLIIGHQLQIKLTTLNTGPQAFPLSAALHTYFSVSNIQQTELDGLCGTYSDKTRDWAHLPTPTPYRFREETDRIHLHAAPTVTICEQAGKTRIDSTGHDSIVVWNPWQTGSAAFTDLQATDYQHFLCVETTLTQGYVLAAGQEHCLKLTVS
jgi:glucose-6-phosphate 1-epimerase